MRLYDKARVRWFLPEFEKLSRRSISSSQPATQSRALSPMPIWCSWLLFPKTSGYTIIEGWQQQWRRWCPHILPEGNSFKSPAHHHLIYMPVLLQAHKRKFLQEKWASSSIICLKIDTETICTTDPSNIEVKIIYWNLRLWEKL